MRYLDRDSPKIEECRLSRWKRLLNYISPFGRRFGNIAKQIAEREIRRRDAEIKEQESKTLISNMSATNEELRKIFTSETSESEKKLQLAVVLVAHPNLPEAWRAVESFYKPNLNVTEVVIIERINVVSPLEKRSSEMFVVEMSPVSQGEAKAKSIEEVSGS